MSLRRFLSFVLALLGGLFWFAYSQPSGFSGWVELSDLRRLQARDTRQWAHLVIEVPLLGQSPSLPDEITLGCGGGSSRYCTMEIYQGSHRHHGEGPLLRFAGNCDLLFSKPRIWLEPYQPGVVRRLLTYHEILINDSVGEGLKGGFWLWSWNGKAFRPSPVPVSGLTLWLNSWGLGLAHL